MPEKCFIIGNDAFSLRTNLLKPYYKTGLNNSEIIFNCLSRARKVVENVFGILVWRFRIISKSIDLKPEITDKVIYTTSSLYNRLCKTNPDSYIPPQTVDREDLYNGNIILGACK